MWHFVKRRPIIFVLFNLENSFLKCIKDQLFLSQLLKYNVNIIHVQCNNKN